jgi:hypothetical protein
MLGSLDSRPVYAKVGGFKKECVCKTPDHCTCTARFSDEDAKAGRQRMKINGNRYFVGYRKNTVVCPSSQGPMPIGSVVVDAKVSDSTMLLKCLEYLKLIGVALLFLIADFLQSLLCSVAQIYAPLDCTYGYSTGYDFAEFSSNVNIFSTDISPPVPNIFHFRHLN